jgi:hypothetical protein
LNLRLGSSPIVVPLERSHNAIVEPKPEQDPVDEVLVASLEDLAQPTFNVEHFIKEEEGWQNLLNLTHLRCHHNPQLSLNLFLLA